MICEHGVELAECICLVCLDVANRTRPSPTPPRPSLVPRLTAAEVELERWLAVIPKCSWSGCNKLGTKWISRHVCNCDEHGAPFLPDVPWSELARERNAR